MCLHRCYICFIMQTQLLRWIICFVLKGDRAALLSFSMHRSGRRQWAARLGSAAWNSYSVTFFSRCAEVEIWALWTCLLVENKFLRRPVKLLLLETWLTIRDGASVLLCVRNQLPYVSPVSHRVVYVYVQVCVCVLEIRLLKLSLWLGRSFHCDFNAVERIVGEGVGNLHSEGTQSWWKMPTELQAGLDKQTKKTCMLSCRNSHK